MITIYSSTDSNEVKGIIEGKRFGPNSVYNDYLVVGENRLGINDLPIKIGAGIQRSFNLDFNPSTVVYCNNQTLAEFIIRRLVINNLFVSSMNGNGLINYLTPKKSKILAARRL